jgi:hypothetical protein
MERPLDIRFEIFDAGDLIRIEPLPLDYTENDKENEWIKCAVTIKGGAFSGQYLAEFMTYDFESLKSDFERLDRDFNGSAKFDPIEQQLVLQITGDGLGHFTVQCTASDKTGFGARLSYELSFDQTELKRLIHQLDQITKYSV